jgi:thiosulfate reductase cytochrome b subunit
MTNLTSGVSAMPLSVRVTHWLSALLFCALLLSGIEILISHPRFYWGEAGNVNIQPLFVIPIPASRATVPTGYGYVLPDQNGWSRYMHFQAAWFVLFTGLAYGFASLRNGHFRDRLFPAWRDLRWSVFQQSLVEHLRFVPSAPGSYNLIQRLSYVGVVFVLFPMMFWTGLAMSPSFVAAVPLSVTLLGGQQSARTLHFFVTLLLVLFVVVHVVMVYRAGFWARVGAMTFGAKKMKEAAE